jgi:hypothetical protein
MAEEFSTELVKRFTGEIASRLSKASAPATTAQTLNSQGLTEHAFGTLMDVETLIFETTALLNAASIINRSERGEERTGTSRPVLLCAAGARGRGSLRIDRMPIKGPDP